MKKYYAHKLEGKQQLAARKIFGGKEEHKTMGLQFESEEAVRLAISLLKASLEEKVIDITAKKTPRKDGKFTVTILGQERA